MTKLTLTERNTLEKLFNNMNGADLNLVASLHSKRNRAVSAMEASQFFVGEKVSFKTTIGTIVEGVIMKVNVKTIKILAKGRSLTGLPVRYSVSPSLLTKVA
jgi:hypothetical protein